MPGSSIIRQKKDTPMNEIISVQSVTINESEVNSVDARELWAFLEVGTAFSDWIKKRISEYGFTNNSDYLVLSGRNYSGIGKAPLVYTISIDMAKELAMVERNGKGREARRYFIECEKQLKKKTGHKIPRTLSEALQLAANQAKLIEIQNVEIEHAKPKVEFVDRYVESSGIFNLTQAAKNLKFKRKDLIECLVRDGRIFRRGKKGKLEPYVQEVNRGMFEIKTGTGELNHAYSQMYITAKGINWIAETYASELGE